MSLDPRNEAVEPPVSAVVGAGGGGGSGEAAAAVEVAPWELEQLDGGILAGLCSAKGFGVLDDFMGDDWPEVGGFFRRGPRKCLLGAFVRCTTNPPFVRC